MLSPIGVLHSVDISLEVATQQRKCCDFDVVYCFIYTFDVASCRGLNLPKTSKLQHIASTSKLILTTKKYLHGLI